MESRTSRKDDDFVEDREHSPFPDATLLRDFKMSDYEKFDGTICTKVHIQMYFRAMDSYGIGLNAMTKFFPSSLSSAARSCTYLLSRKGFTRGMA